MAFLMVLTYHKLGSNGVSTTQNIIITHLWWSMDWFRDNWHRMPWLNSFYTTIKTSKTGEKWNAGIGFCRCSSESRTISPDSGLSSALTEVVRLFTSNTLRNSPSIDSTHPGTSRAGTYWLFGTELLIKGSPASLMAQGRKSYSWPKSLGQLDQELPWILFHKNLLRATTETKHRLANTKGGPTREPFENPDYTVIYLSTIKFPIPVLHTNNVLVSHSHPVLDTNAAKVPSKNVRRIVASTQLCRDRVRTT